MIEEIRIMLTEMDEEEYSTEDALLQAIFIAYRQVKNDFRAFNGIF